MLHELVCFSLRHLCTAFAQPGVGVCASRPHGNGDKKALTGRATLPELPLRVTLESPHHIVPSWPLHLSQAIERQDNPSSAHYSKHGSTLYSTQYSTQTSWLQGYTCRRRPLSRCFAFPRASHTLPKTTVPFCKTVHTPLCGRHKHKNCTYALQQKKNKRKTQSLRTDDFARQARKTAQNSASQTRPIFTHITSMSPQGPHYSTFAYHTCQAHEQQQQ